MAARLGARTAMVAKVCCRDCSIMVIPLSLQMVSLSSTKEVYSGGPFLVAEEPLFTKNTPAF